MGKKASKSKASKQRGLVHVMTPEQRRQVDDLLAALETSVAEHKQYLADHALRVAAIEAACSGMVGTLPSAVRKQLASTFDELIPTADTLSDDGQPLPEFPKLVVRQVRAAAEAGFVMAVVRYREWLIGNREVDEILRNREAGLRKGHDVQTQRKQDRARRIRETWAAMEAEGKDPTNESVAAECGCSVRTVIRAFED